MQTQIKYLTTIGLEVHVQLKTKTKMFCGCATSFADEPNTHTCPVCLGYPGALPVLNEEAIRKTILTGLMLEGTIPQWVKWDRKNYFYPDMPKNYQLTQFDEPLVLGGEVALYDHCYPKDSQKQIQRPNLKIALTRIHLEEDVAKSTHHDKFTTIDFNRAGTPLMEIVSEPDLVSAEEVVAYLASLKLILQYAGVSDADMEKGQMRCDVNISVRPEGQKELGAKIELKNINSLSAIRRATQFEIARQIECLERGENLQQSTRRWDDDRGETVLMRSKEDAHDYRYFPCPDLLPVDTTQMVAEILPYLPERPHTKSARFQREWGCSAYDASVLTSRVDLAQYYEKAVQSAAAGVPAKKIANWLINDLLGLIKDEEEVDLSQIKIKPQFIAGLVEIVESGKISMPQAKEVFLEMYQTGNNPVEIVQQKGFELSQDTGELEILIAELIKGNPDKIVEIKSGNEKALNWFTGQIMKVMKGKVNPKIATELLKKSLEIE
jgi:aspartyl-tRNA(Asn)/glutamyl-tRNA(Gln) amidotransferase subunit B